MEIRCQGERVVRVGDIGDDWGGFETEATGKAGSRRWGEGIGGGMEVS